MRLLLLYLPIVLLFSCASKREQTEEQWRYLYDLGMSSFYAKNYSEAIANLYKATKIAPKEPRIWNALGLTYMEVEEYKKAEEAFKKALKANPNFSEAKMNLGILYFRMKDYRNAIKFLKEAIADETFNKKHLAFYHLARVYKEIGDRKSYIEYLRKATAYNPLLLEAQLELGSAYMDEKRYRDAEKLYMSLVSNNFKQPEIYLSLAKLYYETGRFDKAKEAIRVVLEDRQTNNLQRTQAYELLSKILVEEQKRTLKRIVIKKEEPKGKFGIQIAAFSTRKRAEDLVKKLKEEGYEDVRVVEISGIYKVIYGRFPDRERAQKELDRLKENNIYGFIVEIE